MPLTDRLRSWLSSDDTPDWTATLLAIEDTLGPPRLRVVETGLQGSLLGHPIDIRQRQILTRTSAVITAALPDIPELSGGTEAPDMEMTLGIVPHRTPLRIAAADPSLADDLLEDEEVLRGLDAAGGRGLLLLDGDRLLLRPAHTTPTGIAQATAAVVGLARALTACAQRPWRAYAEAHGMIWSDGAILHPEQRLVVSHTPDGARVTVGLAPTLPGALRLSLGPPGVSIGDPVLDATVRVETDDTAAARRLLSAGTLHGPLLDLLHTWEGSHVTPEQVVLTAADRLHVGLPRAVDAATGLARALEVAASGGALRGRSGAR